MKEKLLWGALFILAHILEVPLRFIGFVWAMVRSKNRLKYIQNCTESIDQLGNAFGSEMFTDWWTNGKGYRAGNKDETLSSFLGKNKRLGTLSKSGNRWDKLLNKIDYNHTINSIEENP